MKQKARVALTIVLTALTLIVWWQVLVPETPAFTISFLDVGQGDAILIKSPTGRQMLIDGGRDRSILRELGKQMGPFDRTIDVVVETHPDADHIGGLPDVFDRYKVLHFITPGIENDTNQSEALDSAVLGEQSAQVRLARRGMRIFLGGGAYADILFPDRDVSKVETNSGSVIMRVVYGDTEFMLTGDAPEAIENYVVSLDREVLESDVLKAGHHGSRTSSGAAFLEAVDPGIVVISAGKDNSYGHPHQEVLERIKNSGASVLSTLGTGAVVLASDGKEVWER